MFCEKCGNMLNDNEVFCPQCGNKVNSGISGNAEIIAEAAQEEKIKVFDKTPKLDNYEISHNNKKVGSNSIVKEIIIVLTVFSVVAVIFGAGYLYISESYRKASEFADNNNYEMAYYKVKNLPTEKAKVLQDYYTLMYNTYKEVFYDGEEEELSRLEYEAKLEKLPEKYGITDIENEADRLISSWDKIHKYMSEQDYENMSEIKAGFNTDNYITDINAFESYIDDALGLYDELDRLNNGKRFKPEEEKELIDSFLTYLDYAQDIYNTYTQGI